TKVCLQIFALSAKKLLENPHIFPMNTSSKRLYETISCINGDTEVLRKRRYLSKKAIDTFSTQA
ncbi:MAG: hypothetical protein ACLUFB_11265, partial [Ruminococcus sp.]|uniref:hypothetical protein n=1 Tax=Ruminococcus sp. TaxID=41978 RepID=UPI003995CC7D